jgi:APA family basic amino acid/polyamine antiporter
MLDSQAESAQPPMRLRREVGIGGATMMGLGSIVGTGIFVSIGNAAAVSGEWVVVAIGAAAGVACLNGLSSAQLAAAHPVSGGTYEYGYRWLHPSLGFTAGWMFLCAKSASAATAALGFAGYSLRLLGFEHATLQVPIGLAAVVLVALCLLAGMRWSSLLNTAVVTVTLATLILFLLSGTVTWLQGTVDRSTSNLIPVTPKEGAWSGFLEACALMFVAYTGYGRIATLGEEIRNPRRNIPVAIILTLLVSMVLYLSIAWVSLAVVGPEVLAGAPHNQAAPLEAVASQFYFSGTRHVIAVGAVTAMLGVLINLVLGLSRVVLAMGRRGDLPKFLSKLDHSARTPWNAVIGVSGLIGLLVLIGNVQVTWSFSAFTVLIYYAITNLAAIRMSDLERRYPRWMAWLGLLTCLLLAFWVERSVWVAGSILIAVGLGWWRWNRRWEPAQRVSNRL